MVDILVKNGHVVDPASKTDELACVGIRNGKSAGIVPADTQARIVIDASGYYVFPGLIDFHTHVFHKGSSLGVDPNSLIAMGVTTTADAGTAGCSNFRSFNDSIIANSSVRIFSYLNVCSFGQPGDDFAEDFNPDMFKEDKICRLFDEYPEQLKGLKIRMGAEVLGGRGLEPMIRAKEIAAKIGCPLVVHSSNPPVPEAELLSLLDSGDVMCHCYHKKGPHTILDENGKVREEVWDARRRGVIFDAANGHTNYNHEVAKAAISDGFLPDIISTDICCFVMNIDGYGKSLPYMMAKYLYFGMDLVDVVRAVTAAPAKQLGLEGKAGTLAPGAFGDLTVCKHIQAAPVYLDNFGNPMVGDQMLVPVMTIKGGEILFRSPEF